MSATREREAALSQFDPLLVQLVRGGEPQHRLTAEGYTHFEVSAVRALVGPAWTPQDVLASDALRRRAGSNAARD